MTTTPIAENLNLKELIQYQDGSIVSRVILKSESGNVTLFAFDNGQELSEHSTPYDALVQVLEGKVEVKISGTAHHVNEGEIILMPANDPHALRAIHPFKMLLTMIKG